MEIKSGTTLAADWLAGLQKWQQVAAPDGPAQTWLAYGGQQTYTRNGCHVVGWRDLPPLSATLSKTKGGDIK